MSLLFSRAIASACSQAELCFGETPMRGGRRKGRTGGTSVVLVPDCEAKAVLCGQRERRAVHRQANAQRYGIRIRRALPIRNGRAAPSLSRRELGARLPPNTSGTAAGLSCRRKANRTPAPRAASAAGRASARPPPAHRWNGWWPSLSPLEMISGSMPATSAVVVMRMGRRRSRLA